MGLIDRSLGVILVDNVIGSMLWALACAQVWSYFHSSAQKDSVILKCAVVFTFLIDSADQWLIIFWLYDYSVTHFGDLEYLSKGPRSATVSVAFMETIVLVVHSFYIWKIWILSHQRWLVPAPIVILAAIHLGLAIFVFSRNLDIDGTWNEYVVGIKGYLGVLFGIMAATDFMISACMVYLLRQEKSEHVRTKSLIQKILILTLSTNFLTGVVALAVVVTAVGWDQEIYWVAPFNTLPRVYTNSFYAALNMRKYFMKRARAGTYVFSDQTRGEPPQFALPSDITGGSMVAQPDTIPNLDDQVPINGRPKSMSMANDEV